MSKSTIVFKKATEHDLIINLLKKFLQNYKARGEAGEFKDQKEGYQWKIYNDFLGAVFYWSLGRFEYTISILVRSYEEIYNGLKLWGVFWKDEKGKRSIYKPIEMIIPGWPSFIKNELDQKNKTHEFEIFLNDRFDEIRKVIVKKSIILSLNRLSDSYEIFLPS